MRTGGVEPPQREATGLQPAELADAQRPQGVEGWPTGLEPAPRGSQPRMLPLHHGHHEAGTTGLEPATSRLTSERSAAELRPREEWKAGSAPRNRRQRRCRRDGLRSQLLPIGTPASACPRRHLLTGWPWRLVEASCTLGPALCTSPCSVTSSARPSAARSFDGAGGIRTHGLELMRLARTAAPLPRERVWPAGVEPAVSGSRNRRGGHAPLQPDERSIEYPRRDSNPQLPG